MAESKAARLTTARYAVRSGPSQFSAYLSDMGSLHLNIVKPNNHHVKLGRFKHDLFEWGASRGFTANYVVLVNYDLFCILL